MSDMTAVNSAIRVAGGHAICAYLTAGYPDLDSFPRILAEVAAVFAVSSDPHAVAPAQSRTAAATSAAVLVDISVVIPSPFADGPAAGTHGDGIDGVWRSIGSRRRRPLASRPPDLLGCPSNQPPSA